MRPILLVAFALAAQLAAAQDTTTKAPLADSGRKTAADGAQLPTTGALTGKVVDQDGRPLPGVDIVVPSTAMRVRSRPDGSFTLHGIPAGDYDIMFRRLGYDPAEFTLNVVAGQQLTVAVTLGRLAQALDAVTIRATVFNEIGGLVLDELGQPIEGAEVAIDGSGRSARTRATGSFLFLDVPPGRYLLRVRKMGFKPQQRGVEMVKQIERNLTVKLDALAQQLSAVEIRAQSGYGARDSVARGEFRARRAMAGTQSDLLTSEDLARAGRAPLNVAIRERALGFAKGASSCVLIDGDQPLVDPAAPMRLTGAQSSGRAGRQTSITGGSGGRLSSGERGIPGGQAWSVLQTIYADQVEAVEIYAENSENSRTACARFPINSPCTCGSTSPSVVVVWLKH